jgi:hypothetical protein
MGTFVDLTGQKFGRLTVVNRAENDNLGKPKWNCKCDCGESVATRSSSLKNGGSKSCGCLLKEKAVIQVRSKAHDLTGMVFYRLTVISRVYSRINGAHWECLCDCGNSTIVRTADLNNGSTKSCGCYSRDSLISRFTTHGQTGTHEYRRHLYAKYMQNPLFAAKMRARSIVKDALKRKGYSNTSRTYEIIGCSYEEFKIHIESQFTDGMSWDNFDKIHIDHIIPLATAKTIEDILILNHYTNLQPLWWYDNLKKGSKLDYNVYGEVGRHVVNPAMIEDCIN